MSDPIKRQLRTTTCIWLNCIFIKNSTDNGDINYNPKATILCENFSSEIDFLELMF